MKKCIKKILIPLIYLFTSFYLIYNIYILNDIENIIRYIFIFIIIGLNILLIRNTLIKKKNEKYI